MIHHLLLLYPARRQRCIDAIARHVAEQSIDVVAELVKDHIQAMSLCEARGYIRARATAELRCKARLALRKIPEADAGWENEVVAKAADRVAPLALRQCAAQKRKAISLPSSEAA